MIIIQMMKYLSTNAGRIGASRDKPVKGSGFGVVGSVARAARGVLGCKGGGLQGLLIRRPCLCRIVFVLLARDTVPKAIGKNGYNMFGECITVMKIPSWVSRSGSRMVGRIKLRIGNSSVLRLLCRVIHAAGRACSLRPTFPDSSA